MAKSNGSSRTKTFIIVAIIFLAGIVFAGLFNVGLAYTNEMEFCTSCHTMQTPLKELQENVHYKNASGVQATCADCHVPKPFIPKMIAKVMAAKDVYHEIMGTIDTPEKYEAHALGYGEPGVGQDEGIGFPGMPLLPRLRQHGPHRAEPIGPQPSTAMPRTRARPASTATRASPTRSPTSRTTTRRKRTPTPHDRYPGTRPNRGAAA